MRKKKKDPEDRNRVFNYEEALMEEIVFQFMQEEGKHLIEENEVLKETGEYGVNAENLKKAEQKGFRKRNLKKSYTGMKKAAKLVAAACLIIAVGFSLTQGSVNAFKVKVMDFLMSGNSDLIQFTLEEEFKYDISKFTYNGAKLPAYIPDGYEIDLIDDSVFGVLVQFRDKEDGILVYEQMGADTITNLDRERAYNVEEIEIDGEKGILIERSDGKTVIWSDLEFMYQVDNLSGRMSTDELLRIANSLKKVEQFAAKQ